LQGKDVICKANTPFARQRSYLQGEFNWSVACGMWIQGKYVLFKDTRQIRTFQGYKANTYFFKDARQIHHFKEKTSFQRKHAPLNGKTPFTRNAHLQGKRCTLQGKERIPGNVTTYTLPFKILSKNPSRQSLVRECIIIHCPLRC